MDEDNDFAGYIADLVIGSQKARKSGSPATADVLDDQLDFAVKDAVRVGAIKNKPAFQHSVARQVIKRGGTKLIDLVSKD